MPFRLRAVVDRFQSHVSLWPCPSPTVSVTDGANPLRQYHPNKLSDLIDLSCSSCKWNTAHNRVAGWDAGSVSCPYAARQKVWMATHAASVPLFSKSVVSAAGVPFRPGPDTSETTQKRSILLVTLLNAVVSRPGTLVYNTVTYT